MVGHLLIGLIHSFSTGIGTYRLVEGGSGGFLVLKVKFKLEGSLRCECCLSIFLDRSQLDLTARVVPGITLITTDPVLTVDLLDLSVTHVASVDLIAVVALVTLHIAGVAVLAEADFLIIRIEVDLDPLSIDQFGSALVTSGD